jgi:hypothetical protein
MQLCGGRQNSLFSNSERRQSPISSTTTKLASAEGRWRSMSLRHLAVASATTSVIQALQDQHPLNVETFADRKR